LRVAICTEENAMSRLSRVAVPCLAISVLAACPPPTGVPEVVDVRHVSAAGGAPEIERVVDLGTGTVPRRGSLGKAAERHDGRAVIGELVLIQGSSFGKQPSVVIGGRAAAVLAHVKGGGVIVRVPWGIDPGDVEVEVTNDGGRSAIKFPVRRLGLVLTPEGLRSVEVGGDGSASLGGDPVPLRGARHVAFSHDGSVAYVGGERGGKVALWVVDLTGPAPTVVTEERLPGSRLVDLETAAQSWLGAAVTDTHIVYFDNRPVLNPAFYAPHQLPEEIVSKRILAAAVGGQEERHRVALLLAELNQVAVISAGEPSSLAEARVGQVLPDARLSLVSDLRFSADGGTLWVVSSDTERSISGGYQPMSLTLLQVAADGRSTVHQSWSMGEKLSGPMLALARGEPIPPGTAIRAEPSASEVYVPAVPSDLIREGFERYANQPDRMGGKLLRSSLPKRSAQVVAAGPWLLSSVAVAGKTEVVVALGCQSRGGKLTRILLHGRAWRGGAPKILELGPAPADLLTRRPVWLGEVALQP
jgi:hypothetical protein